MKAGARAGCSISVSNKCKLPWWKIIIGTKPVDFVERELCEEREMSSCMALAKDACIKFSKEKCIPAFQEARIATTQCKGSPQFIFWAPESTSEVGYTALDPVTVEEEGSTNYKDLLCLITMLKVFMSCTENFGKANLRFISLISKYNDKSLERVEGISRLML